jgi:hypothetical protein
VNSADELAAADRAMNKAMAASAQHVSHNESRMGDSSSSPGYVVIEQPSGVDDHAVDWSGRGLQPDAGR